MDLKRVFDSIAAKLVIDFTDVTSQIQHNLSKGIAREVEIVEEFLRRYLPQTIGIGHGEVVATDGSISNETDIVFYEAHKCPILLEKTGYQVFPIECVYGAMEVKSHLDGKELLDAYKKLNRLKGFPKTAYEPQRGPITQCSQVYGQEWGYYPTMGLLFAYDSVELATVCDQLNGLQKDARLHQRVDFVTVLKKGMLINWDDATGVVHHTPTPSTRLRPIASENPLLLTVIFLQQLFQSAWMPRFRIKDYFKVVEYGRFLDQ